MSGGLNETNLSLTLTYDQLVVADGEGQNILKFEGVKQGNIFTLLNNSSAILIRSLIQQKKCGFKDT